MRRHHVVRRFVLGTTLAILSLGTSGLAVGAEVETVVEFQAGTGGLSLADGWLYSSDFGAVLGDPSTAGTRVWKIDSEGNASILAEGLDGASGNEPDGESGLYQSNIRGNAISRISPDGVVELLTNEGVQNPVGLVRDGDGNLFVANCGSASVQKIAPDGTSTRFSEGNLFACPNGIDIDDDGNLYVANFFNGNVVKIDSDGTASVLAEIPGNNNGHLVFANGRLYVVARGAHQVYAVTLDGEVSLVAGSGEKGGKDGVGTEASFCYPNDIAASADGRVLYINEVADESSDGRVLSPTRIRKITLDR